MMSKGLRGLKERAHSVWKNTSYILALLIYSATISTIGSILIYMVENLFGSVKILYQDALFLSVSAYTSSGLTTVDYTTFSTVSLVVMCVVMQLGNIVLLTSLPSIIRYRAFKKEMRKVIVQIQEDPDNATHTAAMQVIVEQLNICRLVITVCVLYWLIVQLLFVLLLLPSMSFGWSVFMTFSCFNNAGFSLSPNSFADWNNDMYAISIFVLLMPLGNTLFPLFFRLIILGSYHAMKAIGTKWPTAHILGASVPEWQQAMKALLTSPRQYYSHMFSRRDTIVLFGFWFALTLVEFLLFIPEYNTHVFPDSAGPGRQMMIAIFQTVTVRTSGFTIIDVTSFNVGHLSFWVLAMYLSAYPFILSSRMSSNREEAEATEGAAAYKKQAVGIIGRDLIWLYLAIVAISFAEDHRLGYASHTDPSSFIRTAFEVSSAFGNVGLSLPLPGTTGIAFSGSLTIFSKVVIGLIMWGGKHRGLPPAVDKSLMIHMGQIVEELPDFEFPLSSDDEVEETREDSPSEARRRLQSVVPTTIDNGSKVYVAVNEAAIVSNESSQERPETISVPGASSIHDDGESSLLATPADQPNGSREPTNSGAKSSPSQCFQQTNEEDEKELKTLKAFDSTA